MQVDIKSDFRRLWVWAGFGIGTLVSLLAYTGIGGLLLLINRFQLPEEELAIFTSLFYGIVFFVALGGVRLESRKAKQLMARRPFESEDPPLSEKKKVASRIKTVLWYIIAFISLGWLTPALVIYWAEPKQPETAVSLCAVLFSFIAVSAYALKNGTRLRGVSNYFILYFSALMGVLIVDRVVAVVFP